MEKIDFTEARAIFKELDRTSSGERIFTLFDLNDVVESYAEMSFDIERVFSFFDELETIKSGEHAGERYIDARQIEELVRLIMSKQTV